MWNPVLPDPAQIQRACAPNCGGQGLAANGDSAPAQALSGWLAQLGALFHGLLQHAWLDVLRAVEATRALAETCLLWLHHMTPDTTQRLGKAALQWLAVPAVQHVLLGSAALLLLLDLLLRRKPQSARPSRAASSIASTARAPKPRRASGWQTAALGAAAGGAAVAATPAFADSFDHETWQDHDQNLGDDAYPGGLHNQFTEDDLGTTNSDPFSTGSCINPANGLPMMGDDCGGVDIMGNAYGTDSNDSFSSSSIDDSFSSNTWSSDDSWSSSSSWDDHSISSSSWD